MSMVILHAQCDSVLLHTIYPGPMEGEAGLSLFWPDSNIYLLMLQVYRSVCIYTLHVGKPSTTV